MNRSGAIARTGHAAAVSGRTSRAVLRDRTQRRRIARHTPTSSAPPQFRAHRFRMARLHFCQRLRAQSATCLRLALASECLPALTSQARSKVRCAREWATSTDRFHAHPSGHRRVLTHDQQIGDEVRVRDDQRSLRRARSMIACVSGRFPCARSRSISSIVGGPDRSSRTDSRIVIASLLRLRRCACARTFSLR